MHNFFRYNRIHILVILILSFLLNFTSLFAQQSSLVKMKNGNEIRGIILSITTTQITIDPEGPIGYLPLSANDISYINISDSLKLNFPISDNMIPLKYKLKNANIKNSNSKITFGIKAAFNLPYGDMNNYDPILERVPGWAFSLGGIANYKLSDKFSLESGLLITGKGASLSINGDMPLQNIYVNTTVHVTGIESYIPYYIELPITALFKTNIDEKSSKSFLMFGGVFLDYGLIGWNTVHFSVSDPPLGYSEDQTLRLLGLSNSSRQNNFNEVYNRFDYGLNFGIGLKNKDLQYRIQYSLGFNNIFNSSYTITESYNRVISFDFVYMF